MFGHGWYTGFINLYHNGCGGKIEPIMIMSMVYQEERRNHP
jgi:hypothetical protein